MRWVVLFCLGGLVGVFLGLTLAHWGRAERRHAQAVMVLLDTHLAALRAATSRGPCPPPEAESRLLRLAAARAEFELAFPASMREDARFRALVGEFDQALATVARLPQLDCAAWNTSLAGLTQRCRDCHRHYAGQAVTNGP